MLARVRDCTRLVVAGKWEVLALRMALEAVVSQNAPQVRVSAEEHAVHVEYLKNIKNMPQLEGVIPYGIIGFTLNCT